MGVIHVVEHERVTIDAFFRWDFSRAVGNVTPNVDVVVGSVPVYDGHCGGESLVRVIRDGRSQGKRSKMKYASQEMCSNIPPMTRAGRGKLPTLHSLGTAPEERGKSCPED